MTSLGQAMAELIFPSRCAACDELGREPFCELCEDALLPAAEIAIEGLDRVRAVLQYGGPAALALFRLKYGRQVDLARPLGKLLVAPMQALGPVDLVVPIPLARSRLVERGFNQSRELLRGLPARVSHRALERRRATPSQARLSAEARAANVAGCFHAPKHLVEGRSILLVDDVLTTGATLREAARALREAGARSVAAICLLRADRAGEGA